MKSVAAPSVAAIEKWAIREGENANKASAKFAAVRENNRSAARQTNQASSKPNTTFMARARQASEIGSGAIRWTRNASGSCSISTCHF